MYHSPQRPGAVARSGRRHTARAALAAAALLFVVAGPPAAGSTRSAGPAGRARVAAVPVDQAPTAVVGLAARADGTDVVAYRGEGGGVYQRTFRDGVWSAEGSLGGLIVGAPAVAVAGSDTVVAARGVNGALWISTVSQGAWLSLGGVLSAAPAVAGASDGRLDVFVRGSDDRLWSRSRPAGGSWSAWTDLGGALASGPAAVGFGSGRMDVYATGADHAVWRRSLAGGVWSGWMSLGGATYSGPGVAQAGADAAQIFVRGTDNVVWTNRDNTGWQSLGGVVIDAPAATAPAAGGIDLVVRGTDRALWTRMLRNGTWSGYAQAWSPAAPTTPDPALFGHDWTNLRAGDAVVALTFDAGGDARGLRTIRSTLQKYNVPATFYLTGAWARGFPAEANAAAISGFRMANHSDTHPSFLTLTDAQVQAQITTAERSILQTTGQDPRYLFRFPYGDVDSRVLADVNALNYVAVRWSVDSLGWQGTSGGQTVQKVVDRVLGAAQPRMIVLMHVGSNPTDGSTLDADALRYIIEGFYARGYTFVTLDAL